MNEFTFEYMSNGDSEVIALNAKKYNETQAVSIARYELGIDEETSVVVKTGYVRYGYYKDYDGQLINNWNIDFNQKKRINKNDVEVWIVEIHSPSKS